MSTTQQPSLFDATEDAQPQPADQAAPAGKQSRRSQKKGKAPLSNQQQLSSIIKSVRDLLRKDAGLSGDTDRLPQLTWLLFLKNLDDFEQTQEDLVGEDEYTPIIEHPYRWRDWVIDESQRARKTGDELLTFVNNDLFPYLANLSASEARDIRSIIGTIFRGTYNRIRSGYILRDVVNKLNDINFNSTDDIHAISYFYENMLREMRDASGDSGEFYTPRPIVRFIIDCLNPQLGERILDPACGTAGFLIEAYEKLKNKVETTKEQEELQNNLMGIEKKPLPYLLAIMNMLLHGISAPNLREQNTLRVTNVTQIRNEERVDIIPINPPFGGHEEDAVLTNFPEGMRASETALLFLQYVMAMLKRPGGRCGIVLPNGFLSGNNVYATVKRRLLTRFNLHTIVRLPPGAFAPYTPIETNILFFEACEYDTEQFEEKPCTQQIWYYEIPLPEERKSFSKTKPIQHEDFDACRSWWHNRVENEYAWTVSVHNVLANDCDLDVKNPNSKKAIEHLPPEQLVESILEKERQIVEIMEEIKVMLGEGK